jgi:hypothetical protein
MTHRVVTTAGVDAHGGHTRAALRMSYGRVRGVARRGAMRHHHPTPRGPHRAGVVAAAAAAAAAGEVEPAAGSGGGAVRRAADEEGARCSCV